MNETVCSLFFGPLILASLFFISTIIVVGTDTLIKFFKQKYKTEQIPKKRKVNKRPIRSIEINPDDVDRIYVKKSGN